MAVVDARLQLRDWKDKDGNKRRSAEIVANRAYFGEGKRNLRAEEPGKPRRVYDDGRRRRRTAVLRRSRMANKQSTLPSCFINVGFLIRLCPDGYVSVAVYHALCLQRERGHDDAGNHVVKKSSDEVMSKFQKDEDGKYFNRRMELEIENGTSIASVSGRTSASVGTKKMIALVWMMEACGNNTVLPLEMEMEKRVVLFLRRNVRNLYHLQS